MKLLASEGSNCELVFGHMGDIWNMYCRIMENCPRKLKTFTYQYNACVC